MGSLYSETFYCEQPGGGRCEHYSLVPFSIFYIMKRPLRYEYPQMWSMNAFALVPRCSFLCGFTVVDFISYRKLLNLIPKKGFVYNTSIYSPFVFECVSHISQFTQSYLVTYYLLNHKNAVKYLVYPCASIGTFTQSPNSSIVVEFYMLDFHPLGHRWEYFLAMHLFLRFIAVSIFILCTLYLRPKKINCLFPVTPQEKLG